LLFETAWTDSLADSNTLNSTSTPNASPNACAKSTETPPTLSPPRLANIGFPTFIEARNIPVGAKDCLISCVKKLLCKILPRFQNSMFMPFQLLIILVQVLRTVIRTLANFHCVVKSIGRHVRGSPLYNVAKMIMHRTFYPHTRRFRRDLE